MNLHKSNKYNLTNRENVIVPHILYHYTNIDKYKQILQDNKLEVNNDNLICCTEMNNFMNFKTNANIVRFEIDTTKLPKYCIVRKRDKDDNNNVESENEWVIDFSSTELTGLDINNTQLFKSIDTSPALEDNTEIAKQLKQKLHESIQKLEEVSRNELLAKAKRQTITRYEKSAGYKGFSIVDIDTTSVLTTNCLRVTCRVGDYWDTVEMQNILYWVELEAEKNKNNQVNTKGTTAAIMNSIDGMDIKVDCTCADFRYRFAYFLSKIGAKYGKPENRPAKITNPNDYGSICKHLISMLSNKKWLQQVSGVLMDFIEKRIDDVNRYLKRRPGEELTLPNELARQNAKKGFYKKLFKPELDAMENDNEDNISDNNENGAEEQNNTNTTNNISTQNNNSINNSNNEEMIDVDKEEGNN